MKAVNQLDHQAEQERYKLPQNYFLPPPRTSSIHLHRSSRFRTPTRAPAHKPFTHITTRTPAHIPPLARRTHAPPPRLSLLALVLRPLRPVLLLSLELHLGTRTPTRTRTAREVPLPPSLLVLVLVLASEHAQRFPELGFARNKPFSLFEDFTLRETRELDLADALFGEELIGEFVDGGEGVGAVCCFARVSV